MPDLDHRFMNAHLVTRSGKMMVALGARELSIPQVADLAGLPVLALRSRLKRGWPVQEALTRPVAPPNADGRGRRPAE